MGWNRQALGAVLNNIAVADMAIVYVGSTLSYLTSAIHIITPQKAGVRSGVTCKMTMQGQSCVGCRSGHGSAFCCLT